MKTKLINKIITVTTIIITLVITATVAQALALGTLTPGGTVGYDTQYSLNDIYTKITEGTDGTEGAGAMTVPESVSASFRTLTEIYNSIPATLSIVASTTTIPVGINRATTTLDAIDADLVAGNIVEGTTIFGVEGSAPAAEPALTWQSNPGLSLCWSSGVYEGGASCLIGNGWTAEGYGAKEYCQYLEDDGITVNATTAQNIWHLPTIAEFTSIIDYTRSDNATNIAGFAQYEYYWANTTRSFNTNYAWFWSTFNGDTDYTERFRHYSVRCVR
jgi:hypothetical protein